MYEGRFSTVVVTSVRVRDATATPRPLNRYVTDGVTRSWSARTPATVSSSRAAVAESFISRSPNRRVLTSVMTDVSSIS